MGDVTRMLDRVQQGDPKAAEELLPLVYEELRRLAAARMVQEKPGQTLQATALVHEAWLRLVGNKAGEHDPKWEGRRHFFGAAAEAMRRILVENARRKGRIRHGGELERVDFEKVELTQSMPSEELLAVDEALNHLAEADPQAAELVKLRFFVGLSQPQAAELLGLSNRTAERTWAYARAWLAREIQK